MPSWAWVVTGCTAICIRHTTFQCPHGLELLPNNYDEILEINLFQCPHGLELLLMLMANYRAVYKVSMPSRAWVVTKQRYCFTCYFCVSMPSRAWVVTARMSNILNFLWYFLCIPAIYRCILAYLPIFFNQLSKFLRCESPSTFLGTCLSHHSFIIFLVTNTNTLLSGLYLISIDLNSLYYEIPNMVSMPSRAYTSFLQEGKVVSVAYGYKSVNALSGLYLISTKEMLSIT